MKEIELKRCDTCQVVYAATPEYFHRNSYKKDGFASSCKTCACERSKLWRERNPERHSQNYKRWSEEHSEYRREYNQRWTKQNREHKNEYSRNYTKSHPEQVRESQRKYNELHREKKLNAGKRRYAANPELAKIRSRNRAIRKRGNGGIHTLADIELQRKAQTNKKGHLICWWCDEPIKDKWSIDHRVPLSRGGSNDAKNIVLTHLRCNLSKGAKLPSEWIGRLL